MRKLETADIFAACRCMKAIGLKEKIRERAQDAENMSDVWGKGFDFLWDVFDAATESGGEEQIYNFLSGPFEASPEDVRQMPPALLFANLKTLAEDNDLLSFFNFAAKSTK